MPLPLGTDHAHAIPRFVFLMWIFASSRVRLSRREGGEGGFSVVYEKKKTRARAHALRRFPSVPLSAAQETKRQGKRAGHDWIQALELRQGLPRRQRLGRFGTSRRVAAFSSRVPTKKKRFRRKKKRFELSSLSRALSPAAFRRRVSPPAAVKINRHL